MVKLLMRERLGKEGYCCIHILFCDRREVGPGKVRFDVFGSFSGKTRGIAADLDHPGIIEPLIDETFFFKGPLDLKNEILAKDRELNGDHRSINFYYLCDRNIDIREPTRNMLEDIRGALSRKLIIHEEGDDVVAWIQFNQMGGFGTAYGAGYCKPPEPPQALAE